MDIVHPTASHELSGDDTCGEFALERIPEGVSVDQGGGAVDGDASGTSAGQFEFVAGIGDIARV